jgi:hypothetical protein
MFWGKQIPKWWFKKLKRLLSAWKDKTLRNKFLKQLIGFIIYNYFSISLEKADGNYPELQNLLRLHLQPKLRPIAWQFVSLANPQ